MRWTPPTELTPREASICDRLTKHRRFYRFLRLHRHALFDDAFQTTLAALYSPVPRGNPPVPPALLATVVLLQAYANVSDEDAVQLAEHDARWQLVLDCLGAERAPFKKTTLVDFRARLVEAGAHVALLTRTVELAHQTRDFGPKQAAGLRVAIDSMPRKGAGRVEDTLNLIGRALHLLVVVAGVTFSLSPEQVIAQVPLPVLEADSIKAGLDRDWDVPGVADAALTDLCREIDALRAWIDARVSRSVRPRELVEADALLTRLRNQDTERDGECVRIREGVVPDRQISISDPEMRHGRKSESVRIDGYKEYLAVDMDTSLKLAAGVLPANVPEARGADKLRPAVEAQGTVVELAVDRAFLSSEWVGAAADAGVCVVCRAFPVSQRGRFTKRDFAIDLGGGTIRCPTGQVATITAARVYFPTATCKVCPSRPRCLPPSAHRGRMIDLHPREALLQTLCVATKTSAGRAKLRERVVVEHSLAHQRRRRSERARYRGVAKNDFDACRIAAVDNLLTMDRWERTGLARAA